MKACSILMTKQQIHNCKNYFIQNSLALVAGTGFLALLPYCEISITVNGKVWKCAVFQKINCCRAENYIVMVNLGPLVLYNVDCRAMLWNSADKQFGPLCHSTAKYNLCVLLVFLKWLRTCHVYLYNIPNMNFNYIWSFSNINHCKIMLKDVWTFLFQWWSKKNQSMNVLEPEKVLDTMLPL